jgi:hypothetical protein
MHLDATIGHEHCPLISVADWHLPDQHVATVVAGGGVDTVSMHASNGHAIVTNDKPRQMSLVTGKFEEGGCPPTKHKSPEWMANIAITDSTGAMFSSRLPVKGMSGRVRSELFSH